MRSARALALTSTWVLATLGFVLLGSGSFEARAAVLELTEGSVEVQVGLPTGDFVSVDALSLSGGSTPVLVSSGTGGFSLPADLLTGNGLIPASLLTGVPLISTISVAAANGTGTFAAGSGPGGGFGGAMSLDGNILIGLLSGFFNLSIPLSNVGAGGTATKSGPLGLLVTITGHRWTTGAASVTGLTLSDPSGSGFLNTVALNGSDARTAGHAGSILLVTPVRIGLGDDPSEIFRLPAFALQRLEFVPEPSTGLLFATCAVALAVASRRRGRS